MALAGKLTAFLVLVFAVCASAATCADGSSPGSDGCCAATNECPPCLAMGSNEDASGKTCTCSGCPGETVTIDATCTSDSCGARDRSGLKVNGCEFCSGSDGTCMPNEAALSACSMMPGVSISSSGLISGSGSGVNTCDACCPVGTCDSPEDGAKPECKACLACETSGTACPEDSAAASLGSGALGTTLLAVTTTALLRGLLF